MKSLIKEYSKTNIEKFNLDFIYKKNNENILEYLDDVSKALNILNGIEYLGSEMITNEREAKLKEDKNINISRMNLVILHFKITGYSNKKKEVLEEIINLPILFPKIINNFYFIHNGNYYFPIWQIADKDTYVVGRNERRQLVLKTLLLPIVLKYRFDEYNDINEKNIIKGRIFYLHLFSKKINYLYYYFNRFGVTKTIKYFGYKDEILISKEEDFTLSKKKWICFKISNNLYLYANKEFEQFNSLNFKNFLCSLIDILLESKIKYKNLEDLESWKKKLGNFFTKNPNNQIEKVKSILISFERILDPRTKKILRIDDKDKKNIYTLVRWMITNYYDLSIKDNMDLKNKRLRLYEYMINPLLMKFSKATYRMLNNKNEKKNTFEQLKSVFSNVKINIIIKKLIKLDLLRYNNAVNGIDLFNSALKASFKGPQSMITAGTGSNIGIRYRGLHPSYIGNISLTFSNAGDPGMTVMFTPFIDVSKDFFFDDTIFTPSLLEFDESSFEHYIDELAYDEDDEILEDENSENIKEDDEEI